MALGLSDLAGSGIVGMLSAIATQYISYRYYDRAHKLDIEQKQRAFWGSFASPITTARAGAYEEIFSLLQKASDELEFSLGDYEKIRKLVFYVPDQLRNQILRTLTTLVRNSNQNSQHDETLLIQCELQKARNELRNLLGLNAIDCYILALMHDSSNHLNDKESK